MNVLSITYITAVFKSEQVHFKNEFWTFRELFKKNLKNKAFRIALQQWPSASLSDCQAFIIQ